MSLRPRARARTGHSIRKHAPSRGRARSGERAHCRSPAGTLEKQEGAGARMDVRFLGLDAGRRRDAWNCVDVHCDFWILNA